LIFVAGQAAEDIGTQAGGWTITWQGREGKITQGTTILEGIRQSVAPTAQMEYDRFALFDQVTDTAGKPAVADVGIVVVGEAPYAEGVGDEADPKLSDKDVTLIDKMRARSKRVVVVILSGRPLEITAQLPQMDAVLAAWLPGTEGNGVSDMLFGDYEFTGKLPYTWQRWNSQLPLDFKNLPTEGCDAPLFPYGYGLTTKSPSPKIPDCPKP
jgi:beta-glucosidase